MKKIAYMFLLVGSLLIGANVVNAAGDGANKDKNRTKMVSCTEQMDQIMSLIGTPDIELNNDAKVIINFTITEDNILVVNEVSADSKSLERLIHQKIDGKRIRGNEVEIKNQSLELKFVSEKEEIYTVY